MSTFAEKPAHVPDELVRDVDFYDLPGGEEDVYAAWSRLQQPDYPEIFWTPRNSGHWIATRADVIDDLQGNADLFSYRGNSIPPNPQPSLPIEVDAPHHQPMRAIINPQLAPAAVRRREGFVRDTAILLIDGFKHAGRCEFIADFGRKLPIALFLSLVDLPLEDRDMLLEWAEIRVRSGDPAARDAVKQKLFDYLDVTIRERQERPGSDMISTIVNGKVHGERVDLATAQGLLTTVMFGGLDTVATMMGFVARFLATHPEERRRLSASPDLIAASVHELLRRHAIITTGRTVRADMTYHGVFMRAGDLVLCPTMLHALDERRWSDPWSVDFAREGAADHATFAAGPHRCPGANLARLEIRIFMEEWLKRIPDFTLDPQRPPVMATGSVNAIQKLDLVWEPATVH